MAIIPVENVGETGIVKDINPWQLPPNVWSDGNNVRAQHGAIVKCPGYSEVLATCPVAPYHIIQLKKSEDATYWVVAGLEEIHVHSDGTWIDITRSSGTYNAKAKEGWTSTVIGGILVMTNGYDTPQFWGLTSGVPDTGTRMADLTNWPADMQCFSMRAFKSFLISLNVNDSSTDPHTPYSRLVKWSTTAEIQTLPTSWDETSTTNDAGIYSIEDTKGKILDGLPLGDSFMIYKEDSIYLMSYIGTPFLFQFRQLSPSVGALAKNCIAEFDGGHFFIGNGDIYINDGQRVRSILPQKVRDYLFESIDGENLSRSFVVADYGNTEMWACFPTDTSVNLECNKAVVWNWNNQTFTIRDIPGLSYIGYGSQDDPLELSSWALATQTWSSITGPWTRTWSQAENVLILASSKDTKLYRNVSGNRENTTNMISTIERTGLSMGEQGNNDQSVVKRIKAIWPKMEVSGNNSVNVYVGTQMSTEDAISWSEAIPFNPALQSKVSVRKSGKLYGVKFESTGDFYWRLDGYEIELDDAGRRGSRSH